MKLFNDVYEIFSLYSLDSFKTAREFISFIRSEHGGNLSNSELDELTHSAGEYFDELSDYGGDFSSKTSLF